LLAVCFRVVEDAAVVVGANREEFYARAATPPQLLDDPLPALAGIDLQAGGTWLGVNARGVLLAVTNRLKSTLPDRPRSRGLLVRELLQSASAAEAVTQATQELEQNRYAGCNLLCADQQQACVIMAGDWLRVRPLPPGIHVLTSHDVNDGSDRRLGHALWWLSQRSYANVAELVETLKNLCSQPGDGDPPMCLRGSDRGTVSSTIVALSPRLTAGSIYLHAQGPPDQSPYEDCSPQLARLVAS
jgi:uncharacterized protein with NRDE domain